jgi:Domain of unknown function (DUF305)
MLTMPSYSRLPPIAMAKAELAKGNQPALRDVAEKIISAQTKEIDQMKQWRESWYGSAKVPMDMATTGRWATCTREAEFVMTHARRPALALTAGASILGAAWWWLPGAIHSATASV